MDLIQNVPMNDGGKQKNKKLKVSLIVVSVIMIILIAAAVAVWLMKSQLTKEQLKVSIDGIANVAAAKDTSLFIINDGKVLISIEKIAPYVGYSYYRGGYRQYSEDNTRCYISDQKEIVDFASGSSKIRKYPLLDEEAESQSFDIDEDISLRGNYLYISEAGFERAFNSALEYDKANNKITIATSQYLASYYQKAYPDYAALTIDENRELGSKILYSNSKALLQNMMVIKDSSSKLYGVARLDDTKNVIISQRYASVEFIEGINDFIVKTTNNLYGIIGSDGITKVKPEYRAITEIDKDVGLYLVTSTAGKQGVINQNGKIIIYQDYDQIGLTQGNYQDTNVTNRYLLFNNCIPVRLDSKWGIIDKNGQTIIPVEYDGIGCNLTNSNANTHGIVMIPDLNALVIEKDEGISGNTVKKYGIFSSEGNQMTNIVLDSCYVTVLQNVATYYIQTQNQTIDFVNYWYTQTTEASEERNKNTTNTETNNAVQTVNETVENNNTLEQNNTNGNADVNQVEQMGQVEQQTQQQVEQVQPSVMPQSLE